MNSSLDQETPEVKNDPKSFFFTLRLAFATALLLICPASPTPAAITWTGDLDPTNPTAWTSDTYGYIGKTSTGTITVNGASALLSKYGYLGHNSGSTGTATVTGAGSKWTNSGELHVGRYGTGTLNIEAGGQVSNTFGFLGYNSGSSGTVTVTGAGSKWTNNAELFIGSNGTGTLNIEAGAQVSNTNGYLGYGIGSFGKVTVTGADSTWTNNGELYVGRYGPGTLTVKDGGTVLVGGAIYASSLLGNGTISANGGVLDADLFFDAAHGLQTSSIFGSGGTLTITPSASNPLGVGYKGNGTLRITEGVSVASSSGYLGYYSGSTGAATVTGAGSKWTNSGKLYVGKDGSGTLSVNDGGTVVVGKSIYASLNSLLGNGTISANGGMLDADFVFDAAYGSQYSFEFGSGGTLTITQSASNPLGVGYKGNGSLRITEGVTVASSSGTLGYNSGSSGTATVTGAGSTWINSGDLCVGYSGTGMLNIEAGGQVSNTNGYISYLGHYFGSTGTVTVTGAGSMWTNSGNLCVGDYGTGTLNIEAGGQGSNTYDCWLGESSHASGKITVTGTGSTWTNSGTLWVGRQGTGTLIIEAGGQVSNFDCYLGSASRSSGKVKVTGTGSTWTNSGTLCVGCGGTGTLNIEAGGQVSNTNGYLGYYSEAFSNTVTVTGTGSMWTNSGTLYIGYSCYGNSGNTLNIGSGIASDGMVFAMFVTLAYESYSKAICNLNGGTLQAALIGKGSGTATFNWSDGTIRNYDASNSLIVNRLNLKLAATGTHTFYIDSGRTGTVSAILCDATSGGTLTKQGGGLLTLSGANTYTGGTTISEGTLALSSAGSLASSPIDVKSGATFDVSAKNGYSLAAGKTLTGAGTIVGNLSVSGIHAPGNAIGVETVRGNYSLLGELQIELAGTAAGSGYDQVLISGSGVFSAALGGTLALDWTGMSGSTDATQLWILKNDTSGTLSGTFGNYANGASLGDHDGRPWYLYYNADSATGNLTGGNDVVITPVPEPSSLILLALAALALKVGWVKRSDDPP